MSTYDYLKGLPIHDKFLIANKTGIIPVLTLEKGIDEDWIQRLKANGYHTYNLKVILQSNK